MNEACPRCLNDSYDPEWRECWECGLKIGNPIHGIVFSATVTGMAMVLLTHLLK